MDFLYVTSWDCYWIFVALASAILEPGGGFLYNGTNIFPDDLFGANTKNSLNFSHIPLGLLVYFFHTGTGPPDMVVCVNV